MAQLGRDAPVAGVDHAGGASVIGSGWACAGEAVSIVVTSVRRRRRSSRDGRSRCGRGRLAPAALTLILKSTVRAVVDADVGREALDLVRAVCVPDVARRPSGWSDSHVAVECGRSSSSAIDSGLNCCG